MTRLQLLREMIAQHRIGFLVDEVMEGSHEFLGGFGPGGQHPLSFCVTWGAKHLTPYFNPFSASFLTGVLKGTISVGGLVENAPCQGSLALRYIQEAKIRYTMDFEVDNQAFRYVGEKVNIRPWNLPVSHTTCYGSITQLPSDREISRSIVHFRLASMPSFLRSVRLG